MLTVTGILLAGAMLMTLYHAAKGEVPLWVPLLLVEIALLLTFIPR